MAAEHWLRWHHGTVTDPKWRVIALRASSAMSRNVTVGHVLSVWAVMLESASQGNPRGELDGWDDEDTGAALGIDADEVTAIRESMQGKTLDGDVLTGWKRRQVKVEDKKAADRKRAQREREKTLEDYVTNSDKSECHATSRDVTTEEEEEEEKKDQEIPPDKSADLPGGKKSKGKSSAVSLKAWIESLNGEDAIPPDDPVYEYTDSIKLPDEYIALAWAWFKGAMETKRQKDWRAHFRNAVKGNWPKYWWPTDDGGWRLSPAGEQAKRAAEAKA